MQEFAVINSNMKNNSMLETAESSSPNSSQNVNNFRNISSLQPFSYGGRNIGTMPMDYELILNNQTEQDLESEISSQSRSIWKYSDVLNDDQMCDKECDKDVDFDMVIKEDNSCNDKDGNFDIKLKHKEDTCIIDKDYEQSSNLNSFNNADIETDEDSGMLVKDKETYSEAIIYNTEGSNINNKVFNADDEKKCSEDNETGYDEVIKLQEEFPNSNNQNEVCDSACFNIRACKKGEVKSRINNELPEGERRTGITFYNKKKHVKCPARKTAPKLKHKIVNSSEVMKKLDNDVFNLQPNEHFVKEPEGNSTNFGKESCLQVSHGSGSIRSNKTFNNNDSILNYEEVLQFDDTLDKLQGDSCSDCDFDLSLISEKNESELAISDNKHTVVNSTFLPMASDNRGLSVDNIDSVDLCLEVSSPAGDSSSCFQGISDNTCENDSLFNGPIFRSCIPAENYMSTSNNPTALDNDMTTSNGLITLENAQNNFTASCSASQNFVQVSSECHLKDKSVDSSRQQRQRASSDFNDAYYNHNSSLENADATSSASSSSCLLSHKRSASDIRYSGRNELESNFVVQASSSDEKNVQTINTLPVTSSASLASIFTTSCAGHFEVTGESVKGLNDQLNNGKSFCSPQKLETPSHSLNGRDNQQDTSSKIDISSSISRSCTAYCSATDEIDAVSTLEPLEKDSLSSQSSSATGPHVFPPLLPVSTLSVATSVESPTAAASKRHIKSILNTYVSHRLKSEAYSIENINEDIDNVADELAQVLKSSRKRLHSGSASSEMSNIKKPYLAGPSVAMNSKDHLEESKMDMDSVNASFSTPTMQTKKTIQEYDFAIMLCKVCDTSISSSKSIKCRNSHVICHSCLKDEIRLVMASEKMYLSCPKESCKAAITVDSLSSVLPSFIVDLLGDNLRLKEQRASAKAIKKMQGLVICPHCSCPGLLDESLLHFICVTCNSSCCRYCKAPWMQQEEHEGCFLLSFIGTECFKDISKPPQNWNMSLTPFNKNFVQANVPLTTSEGSAVAAFFAKTSSWKCHVVQIFRIQNLKLWEKYVLKRKHVEEEIGAAELKERFLFHGTKAENIVNICGEGFDMRVPASNGTLLGKGIYFSITARYSERYTDKSGMLFLARVICGWSQHGQKQLTRPQYNGTSRRMYDSCVDNVSSPTMYTVFDNSQCYPEYLIRFAN